MSSELKSNYHTKIFIDIPYYKLNKQSNNPKNILTKRFYQLSKTNSKIATYKIQKLLKNKQLLSL